MEENQSGRRLAARRGAQGAEVFKKLAYLLGVAHAHLRASDREVRNERAILRVDPRDSAGKRAREFADPGSPGRAVTVGPDAANAANADPKDEATPGFEVPGLSNFRAADRTASNFPVRPVDHLPYARLGNFPEKSNREMRLVLPDPLHQRDRLMETESPLQVDDESSDFRARLVFDRNSEK